MGEEDHIADLMIMEKEDRLYGISVTIQDILQGIAEHLIIKVTEIKERAHLIL